MSKTSFKRLLAEIKGYRSHRTAEKQSNRDKLVEINQMFHYGGMAKMQFSPILTLNQTSGVRRECQCFSKILITLLLRDLGKKKQLNPPLSQGFPGGTSGKEPACQCRRHKRCGFDSQVRKIPWRRAWQPIPVFLLGKFYGQRSQAGYSSWAHKELDTTE